MLGFAIRTACAALAAAALAATPAAADPATTGGVPAVDPVLSPQGGVRDPNPGEPAPVAQTAQQSEQPRDQAAAPTSSKPPAAPSAVGGGPVAEGSSSATTSPAASARARAGGTGGGGSLPDTGFALAGLVAVGTGFLLTGYALRYSRTLDG